MDRESSRLPVYLHCGFHKTGTTSFQTLLKRNLARLPEGVVCLPFAHPLVRNLGTLAKAYDRSPGQSNAAALVEVWNQIVAELRAAGARRALISSENIFGRVPTVRGGMVRPYPHAGAILRLLASSSADIDIRAAIYLRDEAAWTRSLHRHLVRTRALNVDLDRFARSIVWPEGGLSGIVDRIARESGCQIRLFRFETDLSLRLGVGSSMLHFAGLTEKDLLNWEAVPIRNEGASDALVQFMTSPPIALLPLPLRHMTLRIRRRLLGSWLA